MKKKDLYNDIQALDTQANNQLQQIRNLEGERDRFHQDIIDLNGYVGYLRETLVEVRQTLFALTDKLMAAEANATLAADVADLPPDKPVAEGFFGKARVPLYGKSPTEFPNEDIKVELAYPGMPTGDHAKGVYLDDLVTERTFPYKGQPSRLTASDVVAATKALDDAPNAFDEFSLAVGRNMAKQLDTEIRGVFEPTDEELDEVDALMDELMANHGKL